MNPTTPLGLTHCVSRYSRMTSTSLLNVTAHLASSLKLPRSNSADDSSHITYSTLQPPATRPGFSLYMVPSTTLPFSTLSGLTLHRIFYPLWPHLSVLVFLCTIRFAYAAFTKSFVVLRRCIHPTGSVAWSFVFVFLVFYIFSSVRAVIYRLFHLNLGPFIWHFWSHGGLLCVSSFDQCWHEYDLYFNLKSDSLNIGKH